MALKDTVISVIRRFADSVYGGIESRVGVCASDIEAMGVVRLMYRKVAKEQVSDAEALTGYELGDLLEGMMDQEAFRDMVNQEDTQEAAVKAHRFLKGMFNNLLKKRFAEAIDKDFGFYTYHLEKQGRDRALVAVDLKDDYDLGKRSELEKVLDAFGEKGISGLKEGRVLDSPVEKKPGEGKRAEGGKRSAIRIEVEEEPEDGGTPKKVKYTIRKVKQRIFEPHEVNLTAPLGGEVQPKIEEQMGKMFDYYRENPERTMQVLVKTKGGIKEEGEIRGRRKKTEEVIPFVSAYIFPKKNKKIEEQAVGNNKVEGEDTLSKRERRSHVDEGTLDILRKYEGKEIPWEMTKKGLEKGSKPFMKFRFKDVPGLDEEFSIGIPRSLPDLPDPGPGNLHHFRVLHVGDEGALLQFVEESREGEQDYVKRIREDGLTGSELSAFIKTMAQLYIDGVFSKQSATDMIKDLGGELVVAGQVATPESLQELIAQRQEKRRPALTQKTKGETSLQRYLDTKGDQTDEGWSQFPQSIRKTINKKDYLGKLQPTLEAIARSYPERANFSDARKIGIEPLLSTRSMIRWFLYIMVDEALDLLESGELPWDNLVKEVLQDRADILLDPSFMRKYFQQGNLDSFISGLYVVKAKKDGASKEVLQPLVEAYQQGTLKLTPEQRQEAIEFLKQDMSSKAYTDVEKIFMRLREALQRRVLELSKTDDDIKRLMEHSRLRREFDQAGGESYDDMKEFFEDREDLLADAVRDGDTKQVVRILGRELYDDLVSRNVIPEIEDKSGALEVLLKRLSGYTAPGADEADRKKSLAPMRNVVDKIVSEIGLGAFDDLVKSKVMPDLRTDGGLEQFLGLSADQKAGVIEGVLSHYEESSHNQHQQYLDYDAPKQKDLISKIISAYRDSYKEDLAKYERAEPKQVLKRVREEDKELGPATRGRVLRTAAQVVYANFFNIGADLNIDSSLVAALLRRAYHRVSR
jgi:hypothetical protein